MNINHVAMYVNDLEGAKKFFIKYFNATANNMYHNQKKGFKSYFISFDNGSRLEIMNKPNVIDEPKNQDRTGYAHISFSVGSKEKVDELTEKLKSDGYNIIDGPRTTGDGYYESAFLDFEGNRIEITT